MGLQYERIQDIPVITLVSEDAQNRLSISDLNELLVLLQRASGEGASCVVLTGRGHNFCMGGDLASSSGSYEQVEAFGQTFTDALLEIMRCGPIVIAAVNGDVAGGGVSLLDACDLALASRKARFSIPEILGGMPPVISYSGARRALGRKKANELGLLAAALSAEEACRSGLVNRVEQPEDVLESALAMAVKIQAADPFCVQEIKTLAGRMEQEDMLAQLKCAADRLPGIVLARKLQC